MKKLIIAILVLALLLASVPVAALNWSDTDVSGAYSVAVIPVKVVTDIAGNQTYQRYNGTAAAGDTIAFAVRLEVPEDVQPGTLTVKAKNAVINASTSAVLPGTQGLYYLTSVGTFSSAFSVITAYCEGTPTVTAYVTGDADAVSAGSLTISATSGGYVFSDTGRGMEFYAASDYHVYSAYVFGLDFRYKLTNQILTEDSEAGVVARYILKTLGISGTDLLAGTVCMNDRIISANFGDLIDTDGSYTWGTTVTTIPVTTVTEVPATGSTIGGIIFAVYLACMLSVLAWIRIEKKRRYKNMVSIDAGGVKITADKVDLTGFVREKKGQAEEEE
jgi:hypothetical protein